MLSFVQYCLFVPSRRQDFFVAWGRENKKLASANLPLARLVLLSRCAGLERPLLESVKVGCASVISVVYLRTKKQFCLSLNFSVNYG